MEVPINRGWIKLYRELLNKPIWKLSTPEQKVVLITLLLLASHKPNEWEWKGEKFTVNPGQFVTSLNNIKKAAGNGISIQNIRTNIDRLKKLGFLTNKSTKMGRLISITNWDTYQSLEELPNKDNNRRVTKIRPNTNIYQEDKNVRMEEIKDKNTCPEPEKKQAAEPPVLEIPLIKKDGSFLVYQADIDQWKDTYPGIDVLQTLKHIKQWNLDNPTKRKTKGGIRKHISIWLGREQDRGGNKFNDISSKSTEEIFPY
jgi:hypothetical protein